MKLNILDKKVLSASCAYLRKNRKLSQKMLHGIKMIEADLNEYYHKMYLPCNARLKQIYHMMKELVLIDMTAFIKTVSPSLSVKEHIDMMLQYKMETRFTYGNFPLIINAHANDLFIHLEKWYFRGENIDGEMRHVQELGMNLRISE